MHKAHPLIWAHSTSTNYSRFVYLETWFNFSKEFSADLLLVNFDLLWTNLNRTNSSLLDRLITKIKPSVTVLNVNFSFFSRFDCNYWLLPLCWGLDNSQGPELPVYGQFLCTQRTGQKYQELHGRLGERINRSQTESSNKDTKFQSIHSFDNT